MIFQCFQKYRYLTSAFDRPAFQEMMAEVKAGRINCIVVKDLSRFGRDHLEAGEYLERIFPFLGVRFIAIMDNIDTANGVSDIVPMQDLLKIRFLKGFRCIVPSASRKC